jgi:hypothetical protein
MNFILDRITTTIPARLPSLDYYFKYTEPFLFLLMSRFYQHLPDACEWDFGIVRLF